MIFEIWLLVLLVTLLVAPIVALWLYLWAIMAGPAIRRVSRRVAEGWFEVAEQRAQIGPPKLLTSVPDPGAGERSDFPERVKSEPTPPPPEPARRPAAGPPRYLVPREDK